MQNYLTVNEVTDRMSNLKSRIIEGELVAQKILENVPEKDFETSFKMIRFQNELKDIRNGIHLIPLEFLNLDPHQKTVQDMLQKHADNLDEVEKKFLDVMERMKPYRKFE